MAIRQQRLHELGLASGFVVASTSVAALNVLRVGDIPHWDEIWWDFDIPSIGHDNDTTAIVAQAIAELIFHDVIDAADVPMCVIHTMNVVGRENLKAVFERWGISYREVWL